MILQFSICRVLLTVNVHHALVLPGCLGVGCLAPVVLEDVIPGYTAYPECRLVHSCDFLSVCEVMGRGLEPFHLKNQSIRTGPLAGLNTSHNEVIFHWTVNILGIEALLLGILL